MTADRERFERIRREAAPMLEALVRRWLPDGRRVGAEWVARNPRREDRTPGSFKVNTRSGRWADFASGDRGGDVVALAAYLYGRTQADAARELGRTLGIDR